MKWVRASPLHGADRHMLTEIDDSLHCKYSIKYEDGEIQELAERDLSGLYESITEFLNIHAGFKEVIKNEL